MIASDNDSLNFDGIEDVDNKNESEIKDTHDFEKSGPLKDRMQTVDKKESMFSVSKENEPISQP